MKPLANALITIGFLFVAWPLEAQQAHVNLDWAPHKNTENLALRYGTGTITPIVHEDRTVTLKIVAPKADSVFVTGLPYNSSPPVPLSKNHGGVWEASIGPLEPNIYNYRFRVDGVSVVDIDNSHIIFGNKPPASTLVVHGDKPAFYDAKPVPHGNVIRHIYHSKVTNGERELFVYTPPDYDANASYPVLYLMGGSGEIASGWLYDGRANFIMDNLLAEGAVEPMLVVFPNNQLLHRNTPNHVELTFNLVEAELLQHILPMIDSTYNTIQSPGGRALAGLSMGGRHARVIGFRNPDLFGSLGLFSASHVESDQAFVDFLEDPETNDKIDFLFLGLGSLEPPMRYGQRLHDTLDKYGIKHEYYIGGDAGHEWITWRHLLHARFLPQLWK